MGREIRKVPANWEHPKNESGHYIPLHDEYYGDAMDEWYKNHKLWLEGKHPEQSEKDRSEYKFYAQWDGNPPDIESYRMEQWNGEEANCFQIYETVSEGTPVSPVFATKEAMENWLVTQGYSRNAAHNFCEEGWAPSMTFQTGIGFKTDINTCD